MRLVKFFVWTAKAYYHAHAQVARLQCATLASGHNWTLQTQRGYRTCLRCGVSEML